MSYGFSVSGTDKADAKAKACAEFDKVVSAQVIHKLDREHAQAATFAFIDLLPHDVNSSVSVAVNGSVGWDGNIHDATLTSASLSISVSLATVAGSRSVP